jgi:hypothetical protein
LLRWFRDFLICIILAASCLHGARVRPDEIKALMEALNEPKVAHVLPDEDYGGDDD